MKISWIGWKETRRSNSSTAKRIWITRSAWSYASGLSSRSSFTDEMTKRIVEAMTTVAVTSAAKSAAPDDDGSLRMRKRRSRTGSLPPLYSARESTLFAWSLCVSPFCISSEMFMLWRTSRCASGPETPNSASAVTAEWRRLYIRAGMSTRAPATTLAVPSRRFCVRFATAAAAATPRMLATPDGAATTVWGGGPGLGAIC